MVVPFVVEATPVVPEIATAGPNVCVAFNEATVTSVPTLVILSPAPPVPLTVKLARLADPPCVFDNTKPSPWDVIVAPKPLNKRFALPPSTTIPLPPAELTWMFSMLTLPDEPVRCIASAPT